MKKLLFTNAVFIFLLASAYCQTNDKTITIVKRKFYQAGQVLDLKQVKTILAGNSASSPKYEQYRKKSSIGYPCILVGGGFVLAGAGIGLASSIKETNDLNNGQLPGNYPSGLGLMAVGLVVEIVGAVFLVPANKHFKQSIKDYNSSFSKTGLNNIQIKLYANSKNIGLKVCF